MAAKTKTIKVAKAPKKPAPAATTVAVKVSGGRIQMVEADTLGELKDFLEVPNYQATIDGEPQDDDSFELENDSVVILTAPVKGA